MPQRGRPPHRKDDQGHVVMSLAELEQLRRNADLGEDFDAVDADVERELFLGVMEEISQERGDARNPWDEEAIDEATTALEASSRKGVMGARRTHTTQGAPGPVDNTQRLKEFAAERAVAHQMREPSSGEPATSIAPKANAGMSTSVFFVGMSVDAIRVWVDACYKALCIQHTKASRIRLLAAHGLPVAKIASVLGTTYQQVYQTARYQEADAVDLPPEERCPQCMRRKVAGGCSGRK
jgi:hypothetical protein